VRRAALLAAFPLCLALAAAGWAAEPKNAAELVTQMEQMAGRLQDYEVRGESDHDGKHEKYRLYFMKPALVRIDTEDGQVSVQPNGEIRGRLGKGLFGKISQKLDRTDRRLRDSEGIPFYDGHFAAAVGRIRTQMKGGSATLNASGDAYVLEVRNGPSSWRYVVDKKTLFFRETIVWMNGKMTDQTRYFDFRPNAGMKDSRFRF
jgi:outer membrane lipoprotein-sorting protein